MDEGQAMDPNVWGPPLWDLLFTIAFKSHSTAENVSDLQHLFILLEKVMPCSHCRRSYAMYRKEVKPTTVIRVNDPNSAAVWLWTIHDMVNQKLGKICISYDRLERRHRSTAFIAHDLLVVDILTIVALSVKAQSRHHAISFIQVICRLLSRMSPFYQIKSVVDATDLQPETLDDNLLAIHNAAAQMYRMNPLTREEFDLKYRNARV